MYQALYRKYRPIDFQSVVGQDAIVKTLKNSIIHQTFCHAYMFFGPRGTGKTTVSKIFARSVNCLNTKDGIACGECDCCKVSFSKNCIDIIEIDAASNNGVDEIRELRNKINLVPSDLKYKVYIIDEVHMLSIGAFNALLKTLEEPPEHAIFILATTDPQKVPETIISRCQCFSFKRISSEVIQERLKFVCSNEKIKIDDEVLESIATISEGGMRDALGLLDKLVSYTDKKITMDDYIEVNGILSNKQIDSFLEYVITGNVVAVLNNINEFDNCGKNLIQILIQILNYGRNLLIDYYIKNKRINYSVDLLQIFLNNINEKMFDIKRSGNTRIYLELFLLKFINDYVNTSKESVKNVDIKENSSIVEKNISSNPVNINSKTIPTKNLDNQSDDEEYDFDKEFDDEDTDVEDSFSSDNHLSVEASSLPVVLNMDEIMKVRIHNTLALADKKLLKEEMDKFQLLNDFTFDQEIGYIVCSLLDSKVRVVSKDNIIISFPYDSNVKQDLLILDKISDVYQKITNSSKNFAIITDDEWETIKNEYIQNIKNGVKYEIQEEPKVILEEIKNNDIISNSAVELFGDIVEIE